MARVLLNGGKVGFSPCVISKSYVWQKEHVRQPLRDEPLDKPSAAWGEPILGDPKNLHSKQTKLFRAPRQDFRRTSDCPVSSWASLAAPMWRMDSLCWSADHLVLDHAPAPPDSLRSSDASVSISSVVLIETSLKLSCGLSPAQSTLSRERFSALALNRGRCFANVRFAPKAAVPYRSLVRI